MKKIILILFVALISATSLQAQQKEKAVEKADIIVTATGNKDILKKEHFRLMKEKAVEKAVLTYIENFFENNFEAMNAVLHPRLSKRGLNPNGKINDDLPPNKLKEIMEKKKPFSVSKQQNKVEDIVIFNKTARAKLTTGYPNVKWMEYVTLVNTDGKWKIIDIFWEYYPRKKGTKGQKRKKKN